MSPAKGYKGVPRGAAIIAVCARCHSDATLMNKYAPRERVDQAAEYATSVHGQRLAAGDTNVATCTSCHGAHGIHAVKDARSPVFRTNVAATCGRCHADAARMKGYTMAGGTPLPTTQLADYEQSVHYQAMMKHNDLSAPTCNDCHGNHGATPPGVGAVANVCGTCHAVFAARFEGSPHKDVFEKGCIECHSNHAVKPPSDTMVGTGGTAICVTCHSDGDPGFAAAGKMRAGLDKLRTGLAGATPLIARVTNAGIEVSDQELQLGEAQNHLTEARTELHQFNPAAVDKVVSEGLKIVTRVDQAGHAGEAELRFRRQGLFVSLGAIVLVVIGLALKLRELDRRAGLKHGKPQTPPARV